MGQVSIGPPLRIGGLSAGIVLLANMAVSFAIDSNDLSRWLMVPVVGAGAGIIAVAVARAPKTELTPIEQAIRGVEPERARRGPHMRAMSAAGATAAVLLVIGGGGLVVSDVTRYAMAWVTGNERGPDRLVSPVTAHAGGLSLTVTRIEQTPHFTRVSVTVRNQSNVAVTMPIDGGNCELIAGDGTARQAQSFRSEWNESLGQGAVRTGVVVFGGHLPADANRARIAFAHLFASSESGPQSIVVANLLLLPPG
jgi:hypothetical protein